MQDPSSSFTKENYKMMSVRQEQDTKNATKLWESGFKSPVHAGPQLFGYSIFTDASRNGERTQSVGTQTSTGAPSAQAASAKTSAGSQYPVRHLVHCIHQEESPKAAGVKAGSPGSLQKPSRFHCCSSET